MKRIFIDADKCDGCKNCSVACMDAHRKDGMSDIYTVHLGDPANETRNFIYATKDGYRPILCRHCDSPMCAASCMSGALHKDEDTGLVLYDESRCGSCFMCVMNCPFGVPKPDRLTRTKVIKCDFCSEKDFEPSCVKACPKKAIWVEEVRQ